MIFTTLNPASLAAGLALVTSVCKASPVSVYNAKRDDPLKFDYNANKVRGVNLGGWFVTEPWITPSLYDALNGQAVDEYTYTQVLGKTEAYNRLSQHWNSWITEADFQKIASLGLNHVRVPIGYWSVHPIEGEPYVQGAYDVLKTSLDWAQSAGLKVMIDLHGAPGSQNGFDNSGRKGAVQWTTGDTVSWTKDTLNILRDDLASHPAVAAIELLNEPMGPTLNMDTIRQFYYDGWGNLKASNVAVTFHDAFEGVTSWNDFGSGMWNLLLDTHHYEIFDQSQVSMDLASHISTACDFGNQMASNNKWTISGEWTGAMTDCAKYLNGYGIGARYDGTMQDSSYVGSCAGKSTGSVSGLSSDDQTAIAKFIEAQLTAYEKAEGWIFWTWKTEGAPGWDMQDLFANGLFPSPLTARKYGNLCG